MKFDNDLPLRKRQYVLLLMTLTLSISGHCYKALNFVLQIVTGAFKTKRMLNINRFDFYFLKNRHVPFIIYIPDSSIIYILDSSFIK